MKNSLLTRLIAAIVFLQLLSCSSDSLETEQVEILDEIKTSDNFILPFGMDESAESEKNTFFENLTPSDYEILEKNYTVKMYLITIEKLNSFEKSMKKGDLYTDQIFNLLTTKELANLKDFDPEVEASSKICNTTCRYSHTSCLRLSDSCIKRRQIVKICRRVCTGDGDASWYVRTNAGCCV